MLHLSFANTHQPEGSDPFTRASAGEEAAPRTSGAKGAAAYYRSWLAVQCAQIPSVRAGLLLLESQNKTFIPAGVWPGEHSDMTHLGPAVERCLRAQARQIDRCAEAEGHVLIAHPICPDGQVVGAVVLDIAPRGEGALQAAQQVLYCGTGRLEAMFLQRKLDDLQATVARSTLALELAMGVGEQLRLDDALIRLANELASRLRCERVAIGLVNGRSRVRLYALSGSAAVDRRTDFAASLENAMEEALDQTRFVAWPVISKRDGAVSIAHRDLAQEGAAYSAVLIADGCAIGVVTCQVVAPRDASFQAALEAVAALLAPQLKLRRELARWIAGAWWAGGRELVRALRDPRRPGVWAATVLLGAALAFLMFARGEYRVAARSVVEGEVQRAIVAPFEGFVASARVRAGQHVKAGEELAALDDRDLRLERQRWQSESEQYERKYRDALAKHDRANARILSAQLSEAGAQLSLTEQKLARARLLAPFEGVVVTGDLSQMLGSPVEKGKLLFEVAPLDAYRVVLKVAEEDIRYLKLGQTGQIVLSGLSDRQLPFAVKNIGIAVAEDGQNTFRVEAQLIGEGANLRPGMEGVGKISVARKSYAWIWTHAFTDWLSVKLWRWLP
jgi:multidrug efflux pump subunit AcrA (membrane-fusion protein)